MTFSKFDTQIQIEETEEYQPTAADLAELDAWIDELDSELDELDELDESITTCHVPSDRRRQF